MFEIDKMPFSCTNLRKDLGEAERRNRQPSCSSSCGAPFCCDLWPRVFAPFTSQFPTSSDFSTQNMPVIHVSSCTLREPPTPSALKRYRLSHSPIPPFLPLDASLSLPPPPTARSTPQPNLIMPVETDQDGREMAKDKSHKSTLSCR